MNSLISEENPRSPERRDRFVPYWDRDLDSLPAPVWLIDGILPAGGLAVLYGFSGTGKTFVAIDLAYAIASGAPWDGCAVQQGAVVYVAADGPFQGIAKRAKAWRIHYGHDNLPVAFLPHAVTLDAADSDLKRLKAMIASLPDQPALIVIDTLARCLEGDENDTGDMSAFVRAVDELRQECGATVLVIHHTPKKEPKVERGSNALRGAADVMLQLLRTDGGTVLSCSKQRDDEPFPPRAVRLIAVEGTGSSVVEIGPRARSSVNPAHERLVEALRALKRPATRGEWMRQAFDKKKSPNERTFDRNVAALVGNGRVLKIAGRRPKYVPAGAGEARS